MTLLHASFTLERSFRHSPSRVFNAFADPRIKERWFRENSDPASNFALDFRVDGTERSTFHTPDDAPLPDHVRGAAFTNATVFHDIVENERIVFSYRMACNGETMSVSLATIEIAAADGGSRLTYTESGVFYANADGPEMRKGGWTALLDKLTAELDQRAAA